MSRIMELAEAAGFDDAKLLESVWVENTEITAQLQKFYTLARADLEAIIDDYKTLVSNGIKAVRELGQENAQLESELMEQARIVGMGGERELKLMAENERLRDVVKLMDSALCRAYPNGCYHGDVFDLWNAARAALGETK